MIFTVSAFVFAVVLGLGAVLFGVGTVRWPDLHRRLPRERIVGLVVGTLCLIWAAYHVNGMLEGGMLMWRVAIVLLVPVVAILSYWHLDYLFTRALGGTLLLLVNQVLHGAFAEDVPFRPLFSVFCYAVGIVAMFLVASPWRFRDLLEKAAASLPWRRGLSVGFGLAAALVAVYAFAH